MITNRELIQALSTFPPDAEIELDVIGYEADEISLSVGGVTILEEEIGLRKLHFVEPPPIAGDFVVGEVEA